MRMSEFGRLAFIITTLTMGMSTPCLHGESMTLTDWNTFLSTDITVTINNIVLTVDVSDDVL